MTNQLEQQLRRCQKELAVLKAEYQDFVYLVSHDLSAPLRQIEGFAEIIANKHADTFDDKSKRHLALISGGAVQAKTLLDGLVVYSRLETLTEPLSELNCNDIVAETLEQLSVLPIMANADISYSHLPDIVGQKTKIMALFKHLIHNALLYQKAERPTKIKIEVEQLELEWQFCIIDNGIGVPEKCRDKIFSIFKRGVSVKKYSGLGMGLPIAGKILRLHGGKIWLGESSEQGSRFYFTLPKESDLG